MIQIKEIVNSIFASKTYILYCEGEDKAWLVDIGDIEPVLAFLQEKKLMVEGVFITHGHFDHIYGLLSLMDYYPDCKVYATEYTKQVMASDELNLSKINDKSIIYHGNNVVTVYNGNEFSLFDNEPAMQILETPGHNPGCLAMVMGAIIFTGDSYIPGLGVKDFVPYANKEQAKLSMERLIKLADGKTIYPGHELE